MAWLTGLLLIWRHLNQEYNVAWYIKNIFNNRFLYNQIWNGKHGTYLLANPNYEWQQKQYAKIEI